MAAPPDGVLSHRDLCDRLVIDMATTEEIGRVSHFVVDVKSHQVEGLVCKAGVIGRERVPVPWVQIEAIGTDSIVVKRSNAAISQRFDEALPMEGQEIWTDVGNRIGRLVDFCFDRQTGAIVQYLFMAPGWQGLTDGVYLFKPDSVVSAGRKRMMVHHAALADAPQYSAGLPDRALNFCKRTPVRPAKMYRRWWIKPRIWPTRCKPRPKSWGKKPNHGLASYSAR
jgi:uncharacterized protein YrrD